MDMENEEITISESGNLANANIINSAAPQKKKEPECLDKFNWGAFLLMGLWGLFNKHAWLFFVQWGFNIIYRIAGNDNFVVTAVFGVLEIALALVYGFKGNKEAWEKVDNITPEQFDKKQHRWSVAGIICFVLTMVLALLIIVLSIW